MLPLCAVKWLIDLAIMCWPLPDIYKILCVTMIEIAEHAIQNLKCSISCLILTLMKKHTHTWVKLLWCHYQFLFLLAVFWFAGHSQGFCLNAKCFIISSVWTNCETKFFLKRRLACDSCVKEFVIIVLQCATDRKSGGCPRS